VSNIKRVLPDVAGAVVIVL